MIRYIVDASVVLKWYLPEFGTEKALELLFSAGYDGDLASPELLVLEVGNGLWKRVRRQELPWKEATVIMGELEKLNLTLVPVQEVAGAALQIALSVGCSIYDATYLEAARILGCSLITADAKLVRICRERGDPVLVVLLDEWQPES